MSHSTSIWIKNNFNFSLRTCSTATTTANEQEVKQFSNIASKWWQWDNKNMPLHALNKVRVPLIRDVLLGNEKSCKINHPRPLNGYKILDVGCGGGILCEVEYRDNNLPAY